MDSLLTAMIALGCLGGGAIAGSIIRGRLPAYHLQDESRDVLKLASGVIATLVALVIGLLVGSSKSSFDQASSGITQMGARVIMLDRALRRYGPETAPIRQRLSQGIADGIGHLWPSRAGARPDLAAIERSTTLEDVEGMIAGLEPPDEKRRAIRTNALSLGHDLLQSRWMMIEQAQAELPFAFLVILIFWLSVLLASFGLLAPRNATTACSLLICALSMAGAIYLILEMNRPLDGVIQVSPAPLRKAVAVIGS